MKRKHHEGAVKHHGRAKRHYGDAIKKDNGSRNQYQEEKEYYEIRLESIGGLGANLCGKMLGELCVKYLHLNASSFSSYGSEKTGTPVRSYVRYCDKEKEIMVHSPVISPQLLVIFHQALLKDENTFHGCNENTTVILAVDGGEEETTKNEIAREIASKTANETTNKTTNKTARKTVCKTVCKTTRKAAGKLPGMKNCYIIPAQKIAMETHSRINVVMLGAIAKVLGFVALKDVKRICEDTLLKKYPESFAGNLAGAERGFREVTLLQGKALAQESAPEQQRSLVSEYCLEREKISEPKSHLKSGAISERESSMEQGNALGQKSHTAQEKWGYATAPIGGINPHFGNTAEIDLSPSRQGFFPIFIKEKCINCGLCDSTCPDMVFQFEKGIYKGKEMMVNRGLDYYHCKGCLRCVDICPSGALVRGIDAEHLSKNYFLPNQSLKRLPEYYLQSGPDGYITSESFLTEKRMEGGEV